MRTAKSQEGVFADHGARCGSYWPNLVSFPQQILAYFFKVCILSGFTCIGLSVLLFGGGLLLIFLAG